MRTLIVLALSSVQIFSLTQGFLPATMTRKHRRAHLSPCSKEAVCICVLANKNLIQFYLVCICYTVRVLNLLRCFVLQSERSERSVGVGGAVMILLLRCSL